MNRYPILALGALVAAAALDPAAALAAGTGSIEGTVIDQPTNQIVPGNKIRVAITCGAVHRTANVDGAGHFAIAGLPEGSCTLTVGGASYATSYLAVTITGGSIATILVGVTSNEYLEKLRKEQQQMRTRMYRAHAGRGGAVMNGVDRAPMPAEPVPPPMAAPPPVAVPQPMRPMAKTPAPKPADRAAGIYDPGRRIGRSA